MPSFFNWSIPELLHYITLTWAKRFLLLKPRSLSNHIVDVVIMGTSTCLFAFFLDFLVAVPVSLFHDSIVMLS